jgi:hypothetical protein
MFKPVKGLGKAGLLPPRRSNGTGPSTTNTSHGTQDVNAPRRAVSVVTDSQAQALHPRPANNAANANNNNGTATGTPTNNINPFHHLRRNVNHTAFSGVTGAPKESEIITIGSPNYKDDEGIGAASAEPLVEIEETTSLDKTAAPTTGGGTDTEKQQQRPVRSSRRKRKDDELDTLPEEEEEKEKLPLPPPPSRKRAKRETQTTQKTPSTATGKSNKPQKPQKQQPKIAELIGQVVKVPGSVFFVQQPEYYIGDIKRRDSQRRNAVEVIFRDDNSTYWFPVKDVVKWLEEERQREQVEIIMEEEEKEEEEEAPAAAAGVFEPPTQPHEDSVQDLNDMHEMARKNSMQDEELAAQALTSISASGEKVKKSSATVSRSIGGGGGGDNGDGGAAAVSSGAGKDTANANTRGPSRLRNVAT